MYKWFFAWRYLHTKLIALFGVVSVTLCVAMVLVVLSVMGGFLETLKKHARGLLADIVIDSGLLQGWPYYEGFAEYLETELPDLVEHTTPVIYNYAIMRFPSTNFTKPVRVVGVKLDEYCEVNTFCDGLHYDTYYPGTTTLGLQRQPIAGDSLDTLRLPEAYESANERWRAAEDDPQAIAEFDEKPFTPFGFTPAERLFEAWPDPPAMEGPEYYGVIVGADLINERRADGTDERFYPKGEMVALTLMPITPAGNPTGEPPVKVPARYADDSRTGVYEIDSMCVYVDFEMLQYQLAMDAQERMDGSKTRPRATQLLVTLKPGNEVNAARERIDEAWQAFRGQIEPQLTQDERMAVGYVEVQTWEDLQRPLIAALEKEKALLTVLFAMISGVAMVLIGCIFYMIVEKKTRDIGILKALGASSGGVFSLFIAYAGFVGIVGSIVGTVLGTMFTWYINEIQDWLISLDENMRVWDPSVYTFDRIPNTVNPTDAVWISIVAVVACMVGATIPSIIAGSIWPVRALRYE